MRVLATGAGGYIGNILTLLLIKKGHEIVALDRFLFGGTLDDYPQVDKIRSDILTISVEDLKNAIKGVDAVIDLAALSNDPILSSRDIKFRSWDFLKSPFKYGDDLN